MYTHTRAYVNVYAYIYTHIHIYTYIHIHMHYTHREIMLFIGKPMGRSIMISNIYTCMYVYICIYIYILIIQKTISTISKAKYHNKRKAE